jgi:hypothetical protein
VTHAAADVKAETGGAAEARQISFDLVAGTLQDRIAVERLAPGDWFVYGANVRWRFGIQAVPRPQ